eukprot:1578826-Ditylum_brightwellii.AAC.2
MASVSNNWSLVSNIQPCSEDYKLVLSTNGGPVLFDEMTDLKLLDMKVHFNENTMDTVLSLSNVASLDGVHLTMNTPEERAILVHLSDDK